MLTFEQIKELVDLVGRHRLHEIEIERAGFRLRISGDVETRVVAAPPVAAAPATAAAVAAAESAEPAPAPAAPVAEAAGADLHVVTSPIVGTFYSAPSPDSDPYVRVGDRVRKGQVLCIVEAMKLMNEIECDADGTVVEIHPRNAQPVEYGEPLFALRRD